jgi:hypothetical protein
MKRTLEIILLTIAVIYLYCFVSRADDDTGINLARCLRAETDKYSGKGDAEWAATAWVLRKRAFTKGVTLNDMVLQYCAVFDRRSAAYYRKRSKDIRLSRFDEPLHGKARDWAKLRTFVGAFLAGTIADPCPEAEHFGAKSDVKNKALQEVCPELNGRGNTFYKVVR